MSSFNRHRQNLEFHAETPNFLKMLQQPKEEKRPKEEDPEEPVDELPQIEVDSRTVTDQEAKEYISENFKQPEEEAKPTRHDDSDEIVNKIKKEKKITGVGEKKRKFDKDPTEKTKLKKVKNKNLLSFDE